MPITIEDPTKAVTISVNLSLLRKIDAIVGAEQANRPAAYVTRSEIMRALLEKALAD